MNSEAPSIYISTDHFYRDLPELKQELLSGGKRVIVHKGDSVTWRLRHGVDLEEMEEVVAAHKATKRANHSRILKDGKKRCVTKVEVGGRSYVTKEFYSPGPWGRFASDAKGWVFNWLLEYAGLPVPRALAWRHQRFGPGHLVFEWLPGESAYHVIRQAASDKERFIRLAEKISLLLNHLYQWQIIHCDLKLSNLLIHDDTIYLVDNDAVKFNTRINESDRQRNLRHLTGDGSEPTMKQLQAHLIRSLGQE